MIDPDLTYLDVLQARAEAAPTQPWIHEVDGKWVTCGEAIDLASNWAAALRSLNVRSGDFVATLMENCLDSQHVWLGASWIRSVEVPLSPFLRGESLVHALNDSRSKVLVIDRKYLPRLAEVGAALEHLRIVVLAGPGESEEFLACETVERDELLANAGSRPDLENPSANEPACVLYTSGTTGPSKGTLIPWAQLNAFSASVDTRRMSEHEVFYYTGASNHIGARARPLLMASIGGQFVMRPSFKTDRFWADIDAYGCTFTAMVGAMAHFINSQPPSERDRDHPLRYVLMAPVLPDIDAFNRRFGVVTATGYSMTELSGPITSGGWKIDDPASCGKIRSGWPFYELRLVDENDIDVREGAEGELLVRTRAPSTLNAGYLNRPDATAEAWRGGWFHTGDVFRRDGSGHYYFVDRRKDVIRKSGENISSFEVEKQVMAHESVEECAAIAVPADSVEDEIKVFIVPAGGSQIDLGELVRFCARRLPRFMVPRYFEIVASVPKTPTMRVQKVKLRERSRENEWDRVAAGIEMKAFEPDA